VAALATFVQIGVHKKSVEGLKNGLDLYFRLKREGFYGNSVTESIGISHYLRPRLEVQYLESENWGKVSEI